MDLDPNLLVGRAELSVTLQMMQDPVQVHRLGAAKVGIEARQHQNLADQRFQPITFATQARPEFLPFLSASAFGQRQGNAQTGQG